jgi:hypothetical protein
VADIKAVQNNAAFGQPLPNQAKLPAPADATQEPEAEAQGWDGIERRKGARDRRDRRRRSVSVKV